MEIHKHKNSYILTSFFESRLIHCHHFAVEIVAGMIKYIICYIDHLRIIPIFSTCSYTYIKLEHIFLFVERKIAVSRVIYEISTQKELSNNMRFKFSAKLC